MNYSILQFDDFNLELPSNTIKIERNGYEFQLPRDIFSSRRYKGKKKPQVIGYKYSLGMHMIAGHGNIDACEKIRMGEKVVWSDSILLKESATNVVTASTVSNLAWRAQTFTPAVGYTITSVSIRAYIPLSFTPGIVTVSIRATDGSGHPTRDDLCSGTVNGNNFVENPGSISLADWEEIEFDIPLLLIAGTKYAIVARASDGSGTTAFSWVADNTNGYADGNGEQSLDRGNSWSALPGSLDLLFKTYTLNGATPNQQIYINSPNIFGGDRKEGGIQGYVDFMFGATTQLQNSYLTARLDSDIPAYRGLWSAVLRQVYLGTSPYLKPLSFFLKRCATQISGDVQWYKEKAVIRPRGDAGDDLNPAHIIRECLIDQEWGLNWSTSDIDNEAWEAAADILYGEGFGLSIQWDQVVPLEEFIDDILSCIAGILYQDLTTGKWILTLTREPTAVNDLQESYTSGESSNFGSIYQDRWASQIFTAESHYTITSVDLKLVRVGGVSGDVTISIQQVPGLVPDGTDLCVGTQLASGITTDAGGAWYNISLGDGTELTEGKRYAIVMRVLQGTDPSSIDWRIHSTSGAYYGGDFYTSLNSGVVWTASTHDAMFRTYKSGNLSGIETFDENDIMAIDEFTRPSYGEIVDLVTVNFWDKLKHIPRSTEARDIALIEKQGGTVIEKILNYQGICNPPLANRVVERELKLSTAMLAGMRLKCTRKMAHLKPNNIFKLSWPDLDITEMIVRVLNVNYGNLKKNEIYLTCAEDIFSVEDTVYGDAPDTLWTDPVSDAVDITNRRLVEIPYWSLVNHVIGSLSLVAALDDDAGLLCGIAGKPADDYFDYNLLARLSASYSFEDKSIGSIPFTPFGVLTNDLIRTAADVTLDLSSNSDLGLVEVDSYAIINNEIVRILTIDTDNNQVGIARGILDTVPVTHSSGDIIYFMGLNYGEIEAEYTNGNTPSAKFLSRTANGSLDEDDATVETADALNSRMIRPYPPGNLKFNGESYPFAISSDAHGDKITISWSHRDRTDAVQLNSLVKHTDSADYGRETGVTYTIKIYDAGDTLRRTVTGLTGKTYDYTEAFEISDCGSVQTQLRFVVYSVRAGYDSFQSYDFTLQRFTGSADSISNVTGDISTYFERNQSIGGSSGADAVLDSQPGLAGSISSTSGVSGRIFSADELQGSISAVSNMAGDISTYFERNQSISAVSNVIGSLTV